MRLPVPAFALALAAATTLAGGEAEARRHNRARFHPDWEKHACTRYAAMEAAACTAELVRRGIAFTPVTEAPGVRIPVRLPKDVGGVVYRTEAPQHVRETGPYDVFDCRLVLALSDFSRVLRAHDIEEVRMYSAWRPASAKHLGDGDGKRHAGGLAIDVGLLRKRDGRWLNVARDFHGRIGAKTCGEGAPMPDNADAKELRALVCESEALGVFTYVLTPDYNAAHADHFHMEIRSGVKWFLYH